MEEILEILEKNSRYTDEEIASMRNAKLKDSLAKIYGEDEDEFFDDDVPEDEIPVDE